MWFAEGDGMDNLRQDLAHALRRLRQSPGFSLVAIATLAIGIGANSAIFSVVHAVLLKPLPFPEPERLVNVAQIWQGKASVYTPPNFVDVQDRARSFDGLAALDTTGLTVTSGGPAVRVDAAEVSATFFDVLGARPTLGRGFVAEENEPGHTRVVVVGHDLWRDRFGGDPALVGRTIEVERQPYTVVGIAPAGMSYPDETKLWVPLEYDEDFRVENRGAWYLQVVGRLKPGVSVEQARAEVAAIAAALEKEYPEDNENVGATVQPLHEFLVGDTRLALVVLLGAVGFVLLIACVNVANLLLARVAARESELAVRTALGASRWRIVRQLLTESVVLAIVGGAVGLAAAALSLDALLALQPEGVPRLAEVRVDPTVIGFATVLALLTGLVFGTIPALHAGRRSAALSLREGSRSLLGARGGRLRGALVVSQIALAMVLLTGAGLLVRSFERLRHVETGFSAERALTFRLALPASAYPEDHDRVAFWDRLVPRLAAVPGVEQAGAIMGLPLGGIRFNISFDVEGRPEVPGPQKPSMEVRVVTPGYFDAIGIPVVRGRTFADSDTEHAEKVVLLSAAAVAKYFPGEDPLGQVVRLGWGRGEGKPKAGGRVVGVVGDVRDHGLDRDHPAEIYMPYAQWPVGSMDVVLRTAVDPASIRPTVEAIVQEQDPQLAVAHVRTLDEVVARSISEPRFYMLLLAAFAATALTLAAIGVFGVMSYAVVQRSREIGIRVALGAEPRQVLGMVLGHALALSGLGVLIGLAGALALARVLTSLLFETPAHDPATLGSVAALLAGAALLASFLPARRAAGVDPLVALRSE